MNRKLLLITVSIVTITIAILLVILSHRKNFNDLMISQNEWNKIVYSKKMGINLILQEIEFNGYKLTIDRSNNTIYYSVVNDSPNKYNPKISYALSDSNAHFAILNDEITNDKIKSDYSFKIIIYNESEYNVYSLKCTNLPLMNIKIISSMEDKQKNIPMELYLFNNLEQTPNRITISDGKIKISDNYYEFSLNFISPGKNKRENKISILNMEPNSEYILTKKNNESNMQEHKKPIVELFINNEYQGVYYIEHARKEFNVKNEQ